MLLAIDAGNTNVVFAIYDGDRQRGIWRTATDPKRTSDEYMVWLTHLMALKGLKPVDIHGAIIASVVPGATFNLKRLCKDHFGCEPVIVGQPGVDLGAKALVDRPEEVGADRLVNTVAAAATYKTPLIVIDGRNGPLNVGSLPMYRVPRLVMDLIGEDGPTIFDLAAPPAHTAPRPLPGVLLDHRDAAADSLCTDQDSGANCQQMSAWLSDVQLISHDIFSGHEHAVKLLDGRAIAGGSTIGTPDADGQSPDLPSTPANADLPTDGGNGNALGFKPDAVQPAGNR